MQKTKNELLNNPELNELQGLIANIFAEKLLSSDDMASINLQKLAADEFNANQTKILAELIRLNKTFSKKEINYSLTHMAEQLCLMGLLLQKATELDY